MKFLERRLRADCPFSIIRPALVSARELRNQCVRQIDGLKALRTVLRVPTPSDLFNDRQFAVASVVTEPGITHELLASAAAGNRVLAVVDSDGAALLADADERLSGLRNVCRLELQDAENPLLLLDEVCATAPTWPGSPSFTVPQPFVIDAGDPVVFGPDGEVLAAVFAFGEGSVTVFGATGLLDSEYRSHPALAAMLPPSEEDRRSVAASPIQPVVENDAFPPAVPGADDLTTQASLRTRDLPATTFEALVNFRLSPPASGALLLRGLPVGDIPETPLVRHAAISQVAPAALLLLTVASVLGSPVGYAPEHGGDLVQGIYPLKSSQRQQISTSSRAQLEFHTEAAFHPQRPRYLCLFCLRGNPEAATTLASARDAVAALTDEHRWQLMQPEFVTRADSSYVSAPPTTFGPPRPVLSGDWDDPVMVYDRDLMVALTDAGQAALSALTEALGSVTQSVVLDVGDLLVVDNNRAVHGRSPFVARFDGTDRWLLRSFVEAPAGKPGRIISTRFSA